MLRPGALAAVLLVLASGCSGGDEPAPAGQETGRQTVGLGAADVSCPESPATPVDIDLTSDDDQAPPLPAGITIHRLGPREYCVDGGLWDASTAAEHMVSYTLDLPHGRGNYGETYTTTDPEGSDELLNFPFAFAVNQRCRNVTATVVLRGGNGTRYEYVARGQAGPDCS